MATLRSPVRTRIRSSRNGVTARPRTPSRAGVGQGLGERALVDLRAASRPSRGRDCRPAHPSRGPAHGGHARRRPGPRCGRSAGPPPGRSRGGGRRGSGRCPRRRRGRRASPGPRRVRGRSRTDLAPEQTTATGNRASAVRSADTSPVSVTSRCTPPMPPVAITPMPARDAIAMVAATVVEPARPVATVEARLPRFTLTTPGVAARRSSSPAVSPTRTCPSRTPIRAGTAPACAHGLLHRGRRLHAQRSGQAVGHDRGLERHHRPARRDGLRHLRRHLTSRAFTRGTRPGGARRPPRGPP